ncbi:MAG: hypothetical protein RUMPE_00924 [Eubacteriales bacterium SKADARSKE-1]|nr:hypothetical protein [Eubacteriales bacterium SKADARSKE-1]
MKNKLIALLLAIMVFSTGNLSTFALGAQPKVCKQTVNTINYKMLGIRALFTAGIAAISAFIGFEFGLRHDRNAMDNKQIGFEGTTFPPEDLQPRSNYRVGQVGKKYIKYLFFSEIPKLYTTDKFPSTHLAAMETLTRLQVMTLEDITSDKSVGGMGLINRLKAIHHEWGKLTHNCDQIITIGYFKNLLFDTEDLFEKADSFIDNWKAEQANTQPKKDL